MLSFKATKKRDAGKKQYAVSVNCIVNYYEITILCGDEEGTGCMDPVCTGRQKPGYRSDVFTKRGRKAVKTVLLFSVFGYKNAMQC